MVPVTANSEGALGRNLPPWPFKVAGSKAKIPEVRVHLSETPTSTCKCAGVGIIKDLFCSQCGKQQDDDRSTARPETEADFDSFESPCWSRAVSDMSALEHSSWGRAVSEGLSLGRPGSEGSSWGRAVSEGADTSSLHLFCAVNNTFHSRMVEGPGKTPALRQPDVKRPGLMGQPFRPPPGLDLVPQLRVGVTISC